MNLFENLMKLHENNANNMINQFVEAEIPFEDNSENDVAQKVGRFILFDGLIEIFEPYENSETYKAMIAGELSDVDFIINELKHEGVTSEQIEVIRNLVEDKFVTIDDEDISEQFAEAFPIDNEVESEDINDVDEIIIDDEV